MRKLLKKEVIIAFIVGVLVASGITVFATINASTIDYKNNQKVSGALDDLYTKSSTYKNLNTSTTAVADKILSGYTAYNNNGQLLTGTYTPITTTKQTEWNSGTINSNAAGQYEISVGFKPSKIYLRQDANNAICFYDTSLSDSKTYRILGRNNGTGAIQEYDLGDVSVDTFHLISVDSTTEVNIPGQTTVQWLAVK